MYTPGRCLRLVLLFNAKLIIIFEIYKILHPFKSISCLYPHDNFVSDIAKIVLVGTRDKYGAVCYRSA